MTIAAIILTTALVLITAYYAWQANRTVEELRKARGVSVMPRLTLSFEYPGAKLMFMVIANDGVGPALNVRARIKYMVGKKEREWKAPVMAVGERHRMRLTSDGDSIDDLPDKEFLTFLAEYEDALGETHKVEDTLRPDEYWAALVDSRTIVHRDPIDEIRREIEKLRDAVEKIPRELRP